MNRPSSSWITERTETTGEAQSRQRREVMEAELGTIRRNQPDEVSSNFQQSDDITQGDAQWFNQASGCVESRTLGPPTEYKLQHASLWVCGCTDLTQEFLESKFPTDRRPLIVNCLNSEVGDHGEVAELYNRLARQWGEQYVPRWLNVGYVR